MASPFFLVIFRVLNRIRDFTMYLVELEGFNVDGEDFRAKSLSQGIAFQLGNGEHPGKSVNIIEGHVFCPA